MTIYRYDDNGYFTNSNEPTINRRLSLELGYDVYDTYPNSTTTPPPDRLEGRLIRWDGLSWEYEDIPKEEEKWEEPKIDEVQEAYQYLSSTDWVDTKIDELYKQYLVSCMLRYGSMTEEAWNDAITYLASLHGKYASVLQERANARNTINSLS